MSDESIDLESSEHSAASVAAEAAGRPAFESAGPTGTALKTSRALPQVRIPRVPRAPVEHPPTEHPGAGHPATEHAADRRQTPAAARAHLVPALAPERFELEALVRTIALPAPPERVWAELCSPSRFRRGPGFGYRGELDHQGFRAGAACHRRGPLLSLPAVIGHLERARYLDLQYLPGAFALSRHLARPTRLEFRLAKHGPGTLLIVRQETRLPPWARRPWRALQGLLTARFERRLRRSLGAA